MPKGYKATKRTVMLERLKLCTLSQKNSELFGSSGDFVYLCSRVIILGEGVRPFLW